ncbi:fimbrial biogenesis usher protein [Pseudomonas sp. AL03]|uniref:fimbrial biogenesis usher protein n=1 Tax=Pseudomonas sp. AL03 TaxID=3042230 RepID=UPI00249AEFA2|nr:fimbrial biogenesis usher protein [Pseudomonas sp. AL03]MDI3270810.1 fimbrial biogenesis usher protein [Pseudomonas sp. AL03]
MTYLPATAYPVRTAARNTLVAVPANPFHPFIVIIATLIGGGAYGAKASAVGVMPEASPASNGAPQAATFDLEMLKSRGLNPKVGEYFSKAPRFSARDRQVALQVNGSKRGSVQARFDEDGQLCFTKQLLDQANLVVPGDRFLIGNEVGSDDVACYNFLAAFPQTEIELRPNKEEVSLLVSSDALRPVSEDQGIYQTGGTAGLFNYEVLGQNSQFSGGESNYYSTNTEVGFNAGDWIVRSRQSFSVVNHKRNFQSLYTYGQKTFVPLQSTLQAGQINIRNSVFPGAAITGAQMVPDAGLQGKSIGGATVEGIAQSSARVEVRQAGALIHTSLVPAGPFSLPNVQLLNGFTDLDVRVIEANGEQRSFAVAAASLVQGSLSAPGYSVAAGKVRTFENDDQQSPMVVTGSGGWLLNPTNKLSTGLMVSNNGYQAAAWTLDSNLTPSTFVSFRNTVANASEEGVRGTQASFSISTSVTRNFNAGFNVTRQTKGFRDLLDTTRVNTPGYFETINRDQYGVNIGWSDEWLGSLTAGYSAGNTFDGRATRHATASWNKPFKHATVSLNLERNLGGTDNYDSDFGRRSNADEGTAMYLTVSVPLGGNRSVRGYANKRNGNTRFGTTFDDNSGDFAKYRLTAERDVQRKEQDFSGNVNLLPRYAQVNLGYARNGPDTTTYSGQLRGGVAVHGGGVTLSPYQLADTFGVAKVGDVGGVKLNTPSGPVWTDPWGNAVIPQLNAYQNTRVEIETKSLPRNVDIQNGFKAVSAGRGSVNKLDFPVIKSRRALLQISGSDGKPIAKGAAVLDGKGKFVTTVVDDGKVFITNGQLTDALSISQGEGEGKSCAIHFELPVDPDLNVYFETAKATCTAG